MNPTAQIKNIIQDLYELMIQTAAYDAVGPTIKSRDVITSTLTALHARLQTLHSTSSSASFPFVPIPPELIQYVDSGRNPDIYTREFVELVRRGNQLMRGKQNAFGRFRDVLAEEMARGLPELKEDVKMVVEDTGGRLKDDETM
jgi:mediator of RNA polymerase II transcription subunit 10